jgi:hypothetical protein
VAAISRERSASLVRRRKKRSSFIRHLLRQRDQERRTSANGYSHCAELLFGAESLRRVEAGGSPGG